MVKTPLPVIALMLLGWLSGPIRISFGQLAPLGELMPGAAASVVATAEPSTSTVAAGRQFHVAVRLEVPEGLWLYSPTPRGRLVQPKPLVVSAAAGGWKVHPPRYPAPVWHTTTAFGTPESNLVYEGSVTVYVPVTAGHGVESQDIVVNVTGQTCDDDGCYPVNVRTQTQVRVADATEVPAGPLIPDETRTAAQWDAELPQEPPALGGAATQPRAPGAGMAGWAALTLAFLAGITLNIMPCVLPVIPIKIMSILQQAKESHRRSVTLGLGYGAGIVLFFAVMGAISVAVRLTTGAVFNLNEPFGNPVFLIGMALLLVAAALWLLGVYTITIGGRWGAVAGQGHVGSMAMGFFTAVLATPCSGPVLVTVFGWSQGQPAWAGAAVFALLGVGMAAPHAVLAAFPSLLAKLPAPGIWMERFKQAMGLVLLLVAIWLIAALGSATWMAWVAAYAVILAGCLWVAGAWVTINTPAVKRRLVRGTALAVAVIAGGLMLPRPAPDAIDWQPLDPAGIHDAVANGDVVLTKYTAVWCTVCKIVDYRVYNRTETANALAERGVITMEGDVTRNDSLAAKTLRDTLGEPGPPVTVIYGSAVAEPIRLHGVFSLEELLAAVDRAAGTATGGG